MQDREIIALYWRRDEEAIPRTAEKYGGLCRRVAWNILSDQEDAKECVNDAWLGAWNAMPPHRPGALSAFLARLTRNAAFNRYKAGRAQKRGGTETALLLSELEECVPAKSTVEAEAENRELARLLNAFLHTLPQRERDIFLLRYWYAEPIAAVAKRLGMKESGVKTSLYRSRKKLKAALEGEVRI